MELYTTAKKVVQTFVDAGYTAYFAGGYVRDLLMDHRSDDIDIATDAPIEETQRLFKKTIPVGINFGILIVVEDGHQFEVATFRKESDYKDGRRPESVESASPEEDAKRRDFTVNGMFYDPLTESLYDYVHGKADIEAKIIRAIGNPHDRFLEDRLRMIRAVRYASRFNFTIEPETIKAIQYHANELFPSVAMERVWQEFKKMAEFACFRDSLLVLHKLHLLGVIFPSLKDLSLEALKNLTKHLPQFPKETPVIGKIFELFPDASHKERLELVDYFKLSNRDREFTLELEEWRSNDERDDYEWAKLYAKPHSEVCQKILSIHHQDGSHIPRREKLKTAIDRIREQKPLVSAQHLIKMGVKPGPEMGKLLKQAERIAINKSLQSTDEVLKNLRLDS